MGTHWDERHTNDTSKPQACSLLQQNKDLLPATGKALDLASGRGGNTMELARCGLTVTACDSSEVAIRIIKQEAKEQNLEHKIEAIAEDAATTLVNNTNTYDIIMVSKFLDRQLTQPITKALKQHGLIYYQTFTQDSTTGPTNKEYRLQHNELLQMFNQEYLILHYQEHSILTKHNNMAELIARKK